LLKFPSPILLLVLTSVHGHFHLHPPQSCTHWIDLQHLIYSIWTSTDLKNWSEDPAASQSVTAIPETDNESILVTPNPLLFHEKRLFFRIQAR
jgi:hypothetical protein